MDVADDGFHGFAGPVSVSSEGVGCHRRVNDLLPATTRHTIKCSPHLLCRFSRGHSTHSCAKSRHGQSLDRAFAAGIVFQHRDKECSHREVGVDCAADVSGNSHGRCGDNRR